MISIIGNGERKRVYDHKTLVFSGGEVQVAVNPDKTLFGIEDRSVTIKAQLQTANDVMELLLTVDAVRRAGVESIDLVMPYIPYARQDRVMNSGEALSIAVFADLINSQNFHSVTVWDAHSDVSLALIKNVRHQDAGLFVQATGLDFKNTVLVSPDAGANKKVIKLSTRFAADMVRADKTRSVKDGSITGTVVYSEHIGDKDFLIVDDLCDGGRTFLELAKVLRPLTNGKVYLYVTHGIFSKGLDVLHDGGIDHVYCPMPFEGVDINKPYFTKNLPYTAGW